MSDYAVGYGKPPTASRFKAGTSGNPRGRPKRQSLSLADIVDRVLAARITYREQGRIKSATRDELCVKMLVDSAIKGDIASAEHILKMYAHAQRFGGAGGDTIAIHNWLPDYPGQTPDQKVEEFTGSGESDPVEWWNSPGEQSAPQSKGVA
jgi:hypothetical protein